MDRDDVERVAKLARLEIDPEAMGRYAAQLSTILTHFAVLNGIDTNSVEATPAAVDGPSRVRADEVIAPTLRAALLADARTADDGSYLVPRVLE